MKTIYLLTFIVVSSICACEKTANTAAHFDVFTELQQREGYWKLAGAEAFTDGGSHCLSFISPSGHILHVLVRPDRQRIDGKLVIEAGTGYSTGKKVESGTGLEKSVLWLLDHYNERSEIQIGREYATSFSRAILDRTGLFPTPKDGVLDPKNISGEQEVVTPNGP